MTDPATQVSRTVFLLHTREIGDTQTDTQVFGTPDQLLDAVDAWSKESLGDGPLPAEERAACLAAMAADSECSWEGNDVFVWTQVQTVTFPN